MSERIDKKALIDLVSARTGQDTQVVEKIVEAMLEEIYEALERGECLSLRDFGTFYVRPGRSSWVFKFNPYPRHGGVILAAQSRWTLSGLIATLDRLLSETFVSLSRTTEAAEWVGQVRWLNEWR